MPRPVPVWKTVGESFADVFMGFLMAFNNRDGQQGGVGWVGLALDHGSPICAISHLFRGRSGVG